MQTRPSEELERSTRAPSCSILVLSCDRYRDLWTPFFTLFRRYWPECELPVYLGTNSPQAAVENVRILSACDADAWSNRVRFFLQNIESDYVLVLLEDFFLDRPVSSAQVGAQLHLLQRYSGVSVRLFPNPPADYFTNEVGVIHVRAAFRVSLQAAIWDRKSLMDLLVDDESPWDFEIRGSRRSQALRSGFYCAPAPVIHYQHVVERGEWFRPAARVYAATNIGCDFTARTVMGPVKSWRKKQANRLRRLLNKAHSRWLLIRYPESV